MPWAPFVVRGLLLPVGKIGGIPGVVAPIILYSRIIIVIIYRLHVLSTSTSHREVRWCVCVRFLIFDEGLLCKTSDSVNADKMPNE